MTSKCTQSAPAFSTVWTSSPRRAKSADRMEGAMMVFMTGESSIARTGTALGPGVSAYAARRPDRFVGFLDALGPFLGHLRHRLRQAIGDQLVRMMPAHLAPVRAGHVLIAGAGLDVELTVAVG